MTVVTTVLHPENDPTVDLHPETDAGQVTDFLNKTYPVNSIFMSVDGTSPASLFGGTWTRIQNGFLLSAGYDSISAGTTGGNKEITLENTNFPAGAITQCVNNSGVSTSNLYSVKTGGTIANGESCLTNRYVAKTTFGNSDLIYGEKVNIMNPYIAVYMWKRVA